MDRKMVNFIKEQYPPGTRIRLNSMEDPYAPIAPGTEGVVDFVDGVGTIHMKWNNGRSLGIVPGEDSFSVLPPKLTTFKLYMPLTAELYERSEYGDWEPESTELDGRALRSCQDQIMAELVKNRMPEETERGLMYWYGKADSMLDSFPALLMPIFIVGGIRFGIFTPTEAGAFAVVYALIICTFYYKEFSFKDIGSVLVSSAASTATIMFIVAGATAASIYFTLAQIPAAMANLLGGLIEHPTLLMLLINIFLLCMGMIMDCTPNILIFAPVLFPIIKKAGIDPYYFACLMNFNLCIGLITPPVGVVLYVAMDASKDGEKLSVGPVVKHLLPFLAVEFGLLFLMIFVPQLITVPLKWLT